MGASLDSVITQQPSNNNHLPQNAITGREVSDLPFDAGVLYEVCVNCLEICVRFSNHTVRFLKECVSDASVQNFVGIL